MTPESERQTRRRTIRFIEEAGQRSLRMPRVAVSTATVFFHRFYAKHAFQEHDRFEVAMACLLLAGKTEESPKKLEVVIRECWKLRRRAQQQQQQRQIGGGDSPAPSPSSATTSPDNIQIDPKSEEYIRLKERVLLLERVILHTIGFELSIEHPYKYLVDFVQEKKRLLEYAKPPTTTPSSSSTQSQQQPPGKSAQNAQMVQELAQNAMNFANDSMHTSLCLQYTAREIAMACVYLSGKYSGIRPVSTAATITSGAGGGSNKQWIELLDGITVEDLTTICIQIMELVQPRKGMESDMAFKMIRKDLEEMGVGGRGGEGVGDGGEDSVVAMPNAKRVKTN
jgi:hypothetical protein